MSDSIGKSDLRKNLRFWKQKKILKLILCFQKKSSINHFNEPSFEIFSRNTENTLFEVRWR